MEQNLQFCLSPPGIERVTNVLSLFSGERTVIAFLTRLMLAKKEGEGVEFVTTSRSVTNLTFNPLSAYRLLYTGLQVYVAAAL
jgi:hypothetical protein